MPEYSAKSPGDGNSLPGELLLEEVLPVLNLTVTEATQQLGSLGKDYV